MGYTQGSKLAPILIHLYVNDMVNAGMQKEKSSLELMNTINSDRMNI